MKPHYVSNKDKDLEALTKWMNEMFAQGYMLDEFFVTNYYVPGQASVYMHFAVMSLV